MSFSGPYFLICVLVLGDNVIGISIISVLLSQYDNNHDNYIKGITNKKQHKKSVTYILLFVFLCCKHIITTHSAISNVRRCF